MFSKRSPWQKEWMKLLKKEIELTEKKKLKKQSKLNTLLEDKVPPNLQGTLDKAFAKAFSLVFEKGTAVIEKTYNKNKMSQQFEIASYTHKVRQNRKSLKAFSKTAGRKGTGNLAFSGVSGIGLGVLGIGIPDIVLSVAVMLKSVYELSLSYGYDYNSEKEKLFILALIRAALTSENFASCNAEVDSYIINGEFTQHTDLTAGIENTSRLLSRELLYMKFLQGIPVVGAVGGAYDFIYTKQVLDYAKIKYYKRFLLDNRHM